MTPTFIAFTFNQVRCYNIQWYGGPFAYCIFDEDILVPEKAITNQIYSPNHSDNFCFRPRHSHGHGRLPALYWLGGTDVSSLDGVGVMSGFATAGPVIVASSKYMIPLISPGSLPVSQRQVTCAKTASGGVINLT